MSAPRRRLVCVTVLLALAPLCARGAQPKPPLEVLPAAVTLEPGATVKFTALAHTAQGATFTPQGVRWLAAGGTIDANGTYRAGARPGRFVVAATYGNLRAVVHVRIKVFPKIVRVVVVPRQATLDVGQTCQLLAVAYDAANNPVPFRPAWSSTAGGTVTNTGLFTANVAGRHTVMARDLAARRTGVAVILAEAPGRRAVRLDVTPKTVRLRPGDQVAFAVTAFDARGRPVPFVPAWSAQGGRIDANGVFTAGRRSGVFPVVVVDRRSGLSTTATVTVGRRSPPPPPADLTVTEWDQGGNFLRPRIRITARVSGRAAARIALFAVGPNGRETELESKACKHGDVVKFSEKFIRVTTRWLELRLLDAAGNVLASARRRVK